MDERKGTSRNARPSSGNFGTAAYRPQYTRAGRQFSPKKAVKSFRDLDVYQAGIACAAIVSKDVMPDVTRHKYPFAERMHEAALGVPLCVAQAHSVRFADFPLALGYLEKAMAGCNKIVVYLEHVRGIYGDKFDQGLVEDLIKRYTEARGKMFRLEKAWRKFRSEQGATNS